MRLLAATEMDLKDLVDSGLFLEQLFDRLRLIPINVPPLRERPEDLLPLAHHLLRRQAAAAGQAAPGLEPGVAEALQAYPWPGNLAEMETAIAQGLGQARTGRLARSMLPEAVQAAAAEDAAHGGGKPEQRYKMLRTFLYTLGKAEGKADK